jgi:GDPmannose 4,6-dehydratase
LQKGYQVYGIVRRSSTINRQRIDHFHDNPKLKLLYGDLADSSSINNIIREVMPDEIYNLGAQSHVKISFDTAEYTGDIDGIGVVRILEAIRKIKEETGKNIKLYQASTSELYGQVHETPQKETTPFHPRSPYGCAKLYAYWMVRNYREGYGLFACNGILFNHESPRRGENFVSRKITLDVVRIKEGLKKCIYLGNLDAKRDWGHAKDYVEAMWLMLQHDTADDYVIATGETRSVRDFLEEAFAAVGISIKSNGKAGIDEEYIRTDTNEVVVKVDPKFFRPTEVDILLGDNTKAKKELHWKPKTSFKALVQDMIKSDMDDLHKQIHGYGKAVSINKV